VRERWRDGEMERVGENAYGKISDVIKETAIWTK